MTDLPWAGLLWGPVTGYDQGMLQHILYSTAALLALTAPFVELPIFLSVTAGQSAGQRRLSSVKVGLGTLVVLGVSTLVGSNLLELVGVSLPAFRAAGGLVVVIVGLEMLHGGSSMLGEQGSVDGDPDALWVPIVMPLIAGPAAITAAITLAIRETSMNGSTVPVGTLTAVAIASLVVLVTLLFSQGASRLIGVRAARIVERFFGLICVAIGFQMGFTGIQQFFLGG